MVEFRMSYVPSAPASTPPWDQILALAPHIIWAAVLLGILAWIGRANLLAALKRVNKVTIAGVELQFREELEAAALSRGIDLSSEELGRAARRMAASRDLLRNAKLLWVDDCPDRIVKESRLMEETGARITRVTSTRDALARLDADNYDLVLSDIRRGEDAAAGLTLGNALAERMNAPPLIFYVGESLRPTPETAFGITDRPSELLHLVLDALSRVRG